MAINHLLESTSSARGATRNKRGRRAGRRVQLRRAHAIRERQLGSRRYLTTLTGTGAVCARDEGADEVRAGRPGWVGAGDTDDRQRGTGEAIPVRVGCRMPYLHKDWMWPQPVDPEPAVPVTRCLVRPPRLALSQTRRAAADRTAKATEPKAKGQRSGTLVLGHINIIPIQTSDGAVAAAADSLEAATTEQPGPALAATDRHTPLEKTATAPLVGAAGQHPAEQANKKTGVTRQPHVADANGHRDFSIIALNILSLKPKILDLRHDLESLNCDIAVITETWLRPETSSRFVTFPGFSLHRADRPDGSGYGGIAVLIKNNLKVKSLKSVVGAKNDGKIETFWLQVSNPHGRRFNLGCVYRPPRHTVAAISADLDFLETEVQRVLLSSSDNIVITGDINCNLLASDKDVCKSRFNQFLDSLALHQHVTSPTYESGSLLDVFVSRTGNFLSDVSVHPCPYSDHCIIQAKLSIPKPRRKPIFVSSRRLHRINIPAFHAALCATDWSGVFSRVEVADQWTALINCLLPILDHHAPLKRIKIRNPSAPSVTDTTRNLMAQRRRLLVHSGRTPEFIALNKQVRSAIRQDTRQDIARRVRELGPTTIFRNVRQIIAGKKSADRILPEATPDELNQYFVGVGPQVASEVRARGEPPSLPVRLPRVGTCAFKLQPISLSALRFFLSSMKNSGACGADGISMQVIKLCAAAIGPVFLHIINTCLSSGEYPAPWKHSIVHPIHKAGSQSEASNFRPISIVPAFPKLIERIVQRQLYSYMSDNHLFSSSQHGFRSLLSTETALLTVSDHILSAIDHQELTLLCLLDLSKCFDVIDHSMLLSKLRTYNIDPTWFTSYLCGHTQSVCTTDGNGKLHLSRPLPNSIGVFQGSSLGPLLFQIFANDMCLFAGDAHVVQYADDTQILLSGKKHQLNDMVSKLEDTLSALDTWFHFHGLKVNASKTELIAFGSRQNCRDLDLITARFRKDRVQESSNVKNLGVVFDKHLTWDSHVSSLVKKCSGILIGLSHVRHSIPRELLPPLVDALVVSHVRYCLAVFGNGSQKNIQRLDKILNFALRVISGRRKFDHISDVRAELGWPTAQQLYRQHSLNLLHKIRNTGEPQALASQLQVNSDLRSRSTRQNSDLALPRVRTEAGKRRFLYHVVKNYNDLPLEIRHSTMPAFKTKIKNMPRPE